MSVDTILALFAAAGVLLTIFVSLFTATQAASKSGFDQLERSFEKLEKRYTEMEKRLAHLEQENRDLRHWAEQLVDQVEGAGLVPVEFKRTAFSR